VYEKKYSKSFRERKKFRKSFRVKII
jgi:hypothetical protein